KNRSAVLIWFSIPTKLSASSIASSCALVLEWDWVFIAGASASNLPWASARIEEERRLFYVGITRAKRSLSISYAGEPSPFLREAGLVSA
ncbi:MAG: 3'-5' exonuclease, partial [Actinomycetota bacterium]